MNTRITLLTAVIAAAILSSLLLLIANSKSSADVSNINTHNTSHFQNVSYNSFLALFNRVHEMSNRLGRSESLKEAINLQQWNHFLQAADPGTSLPVELALYDSVSNVLHFKDGTSPKGQYLGLENTLLNQIKQPGRRNDVVTFRDSEAIVFSNGIHQDQKLTGILFVIMPFNKSLIEHLKQTTNLDYVLKVKGQTYTTDPQFNLTNTQTTEWPSALKLKGQLNYHQPSWSIHPGIAFNWTAMVVIVIIFVVIVGLVIWMQMQQQRRFKILSHVVNKERALANIVEDLQRLDDMAELETMKNDLQQVLQLQQANIKQLNGQIKQAKLVNDKLKSEAQTIKQELSTAAAAPKTKSEFLSRMGDEITTPMKTLTSMLHLLSEYNLNDEPKELLTIARRAAGTLINNLNNILDFSKLDANLLKLQKVEFEVQQLLDEISAEYSPHAKSKGLKFSVNLSPEVGEKVFNDPKRIKQIIKNLIGNAIRFTKEGEVSLFADLMVNDSKQFLKFTVKDTGVGIPEDAQKGLFDSLEQKTRLTNSSFAGRLRLIVSKSLAELMGGRIGINSDSGQGSRFWFTVSMTKD
ncbi:HAMP domain-containing sensor histidine kinase [Pleionea sp. CnH1-48]|uniref:sensor histidine kinase n=1 Tax=Pleionea sp. CnH1-48 TaxID=2954494 RepID=UPI002097FC13|nr:ATP-binding protein [Pleionea sp. CnH1-48]MCO7226804.1 ATP-binding protein [Pleionea sp. CnH1-48]